MCPGTVATAAAPVATRPIRKPATCYGIRGDRSAGWPVGAIALPIAPNTVTLTIARGSAPSFPPIDDAAAALAAVDWHALADRLISAALLVAAVAVALTRRALPYVAAALRALADRVDRAAAAPIDARTVAELRAAARAAGLPRRLYTYGRRAELIAALA